MNRKFKIGEVRKFKATRAAVLIVGHSNPRNYEGIPQTPEFTNAYFCRFQGKDQLYYESTFHEFELE